MRYLIILLLLTSCKTEPQKKVEPKNESGWTLVDVKDKFGDPTGEKSVGGYFEGTMKNTATNNAPIAVGVTLGDSSVFYNILEYGNVRATIPSSKFINVDYKLSDGTIKTIKHFTFKGYITNNKELYELLMTETNPFKCQIDMGKISDIQMPVYNFTIDPKGLKELL